MEKIMNFFKSNATKLVHSNNVYRDRKESRKPKAQIEDVVIKHVRNLFRTKKRKWGDQ